MKINLPLLSMIIGSMSADDDAWVRHSSEPGNQSTLEVFRETSGCFSFGVYDVVDGDREVVIAGRAVLDEDGLMLIEPEDHAKYQSFVEASRAFPL